MDPITNPYAPGAGTPPPELACRDELREIIRIALARVRAGRPTKSVLMVGLRGVGKTVLLSRMRDDAELSAIHTMQVEAPEIDLCHRFWLLNFGKLSFGCREMPRRRSLRLEPYAGWPASPRRSR